MSQKLRQNKNFLNLLLLTSSAQAKSLLQTITPQQVLTVVEIVYNLMKIVTSAKDKAVIKKRSGFLRKLSNKRTTLAVKKKLIVKHRAKLLKTLLHFKKVLLNLVK